MVLHHMCFHIQKSADRGLFAAPRSLSQLVTSFFGSWCQGILLVLLFAWTSFVVQFYLHGPYLFSLSRIAEYISNSFWFVLLFSPFPQLLVRLKLYFFTLNLNLNLERPIWFQILSFSLLTYVNLSVFRVLIKLI